MRLATWNINSVRLRLDLLKRLIDMESPDVICLQETKVIDDAFPIKKIEELGYKHNHFHGMKSYNGVAILSRLPLTQKKNHDRCEKNDRRHISARLPNGVEVHCIYIPAGGDIPDPKTNIKFAHKLAFLDELAAWSKKTKKTGESMILAGDFNVAPLEHDVWSHKQMQKIVSHTAIEIEKLNGFLAARDYIDAARMVVPHDQKFYSWWSYRAMDWENSNRGRRLDHIWTTPDQKTGIKDCRALKEVRGWDPKPSDHVPVILDMG